MPDKTQAEIPYSHIEYTAVFKKPIIGAWSPPANLIAALLSRLEHASPPTRSKNSSASAPAFSAGPPARSNWSISAAEVWR